MSDLRPPQLSNLQPPQTVRAADADGQPAMALLSVGTHEIG